MQRWQMTWGEQEYDLWREMCNPDVLNLINEDAFGFDSTFWANYATVLTAVAFDGESWAQRSAEINPLIESVLDDYRA